MFRILLSVFCLWAPLSFCSLGAQSSQDFLPAKRVSQGEQLPVEEDPAVSHINRVVVRASGHITLNPSRADRKKTAGLKKGIYKSFTSGEVRGFYKGNFSIEVREGSLEISERDFFKKINQKQGAVPTLELFIPHSMRVHVYGRSGHILLNSVRASVNVSQFGKKSKITVRNTKGNLKLFQVDGHTAITSHRGSLDIQAEDVRVKVEDHKGNLSANIFSGTFQVVKSSGSLDWQSYSAVLLVENFRGPITFFTRKAPVNIKSHYGSLKGSSEEGEVYAKAFSPFVKLETKKSNITLDLPKSRVWVTAQSMDGKLRVPFYFYRSYAGGMDRASGRLRGAQFSEGSADLKSGSGTIRVVQSQK